MAWNLSTARRLCTRNWNLKLLSLMLAVCVWSFSSLSRETSHELVLPVELRNVPPGYTVSQPFTGEVRFTLTGPSILIDGVRRANTRLILSLRDAGPGTTRFSNLEANLKLPEGIKVTRVSPATLEIGLIRKQTNTDQGAPVP